MLPTRHRVRRVSRRLWGGEPFSSETFVLPFTYLFFLLYCPPSIASQMFSYVDASVSFADIAWVRKHSGGLPVIVKVRSLFRHFSFLRLTYRSSRRAS